MNIHIEVSGDGWMREGDGWMTFQGQQESKSLGPFREQDAKPA